MNMTKQKTQKIQTTVVKGYVFMIARSRILCMNIYNHTHTHTHTSVNIFVDSSALHLTSRTQNDSNGFSPRKAWRERCWAANSCHPPFSELHWLSDAASSTMMIKFSWMSLSSRVESSRVIHTSNLLILGANAMDCLEANPIRPVCCLRGRLVLFELKPPLSSLGLARPNLGVVLVSGSSGVGEGDMVEVGVL